MKLTKNNDFFKKQINTDVETEEKSDTEVKVAKVSRAESICATPELRQKLGTVSKTLGELNLSGAAKKIAAITSQAHRDRFSVAVVGEFSKGKSTFINKMLGRDLLPVADLPSTAMMTRIRFCANEVMVVVDENGNKVKSMPLSKLSWDGLTADAVDGNGGGVVFLGVDDMWLEESNVEIVDTPGAGDLEEGRARVIGNALLGCDGAIITISATAAMSQSEKLFIEQRLISKKTPFLMLIVTKLDQVPAEERGRVIEYIKSKLALWNMNIPVYVPYTVDMPTDEYDGIIGIDKIRTQISEWASSPERVALTEEWIKEKVREVIENEQNILREQKVLMDADDAERQKLIAEKEAQLDEAQIYWETLKTELLTRKNECYKILNESVEQKQGDIIERLQYEAGHAQDPQKWWQEDYPYRLKVELSNLSVAVESAVSKKISDDIRWLNAALDTSFKSHVLFEKEQIVDKDAMGSGQLSGVSFENIAKKKTVTRIGTTVATIALASALASVGGLVLVATMGVGTVASIISEKVFKGKMEKQREQLKSLVAESVPKAIASAIEESEARLSTVYDDIVTAATQKENEWLASQRELIKRSCEPKNIDKRESISVLSDKLSALSNII